MSVRGAGHGLVAGSWERSRSRGLDPSVAAATVDLEGPALTAHLAGHRMSAVLPVVESVLVEGVVESGHLVAVTDEVGRLLSVYGDRGVRGRAERMAFVPGAVWSDDEVGANAPGLALRHDRAVRVRGEEHFLAPAHSWSCSAAPVHDPVTGRVVGAIDVTGRAAAASDEMLALVRATALLAEAQLRVGPGGMVLPASAYPAPRRLRLLGTLRPTLDGRELTRRHAEILALLSDRPDGLGGGALAELLAEGRLDEVSVRAELSRLRRVLGPGVLGSRPYRLTPGLLAVDLLEVGRLVETDPVAVVAAYPGPLLPGSDAPGVVDLREDLHARVRATVLASGSVEALRAWVAGPGCEDVGAWRALARVPGAPDGVRSRAASMGRVLDGRLGA